MPPLAVGLVVVAAFTHASWNLVAKRASGARHFVWFYSAGSTVIFVAARTGWPLQPLQMALLGGSAALHLLYSQSLQRGYRIGDLSVVYPIARGTGRLLSFLGAILVLQEHPSPLAASGALAVVVGVLRIAGPDRARHVNTRSTGVAWGIVTGALIASYTLADGYAVKSLMISPVILDTTGNLVRTVVLLPLVWRDRRQAFGEYRSHWSDALLVSVLGPAGYMLVLFAMTLAPISQVAPARELSMTVGAYFGSRFLGERYGRRRLVASALIVAGVIGLAFG